MDCNAQLFKISSFEIEEHRVCDTIEEETLQIQQAVEETKEIEEQLEEQAIVEKEIEEAEQEGKPVMDPQIALSSIQFTNVELTSVEYELEETETEPEPVEEIKKIIVSRKSPPKNKESENEGVENVKYFLRRGSRRRDEE